MNIYLFHSSIKMTTVHILLVIMNPNIYTILLLVGCLTSILNHGYTNTLLKYTDRTTMILLFLYETILERLKTYLLICISLILFILAKLLGKQTLHMISHVILTIHHIIQSCESL